MILRKRAGDKDAAETTEVKTEEKQKASQPDTSALHKECSPKRADRMQVIRGSGEIKM